jgi:hypothetical protein
VRLGFRHKPDHINGKNFTPPPHFPENMKLRVFVPARFADAQAAAQTPLKRGVQESLAFARPSMLRFVALHKVALL